MEEEIIEEKQTGNIIKAIHERMANLDEPVRNLILSDEYVINLGEIVNTHNLKQEEITTTEEITTNFLLGTIKPSELEQTFIENLSHLNKQQIQSLYNEIKTKILKPVWTIIEQAWIEDDENEAIFNNVLEMSEVPLPPNKQTSTIKTLGDKINNDINKGQSSEQIVQSIRPSNVLSNEQVLKKNEKLNEDTKHNNVSAKEDIKPVNEILEKTNKDTKNSEDNVVIQNQEPLNNSDTTIKAKPKLNNLNKDIYREIPD